jgi:long-subunit acyl-CoA synthetase (AMP-forming)
LRTAPDAPAAPAGEHGYMAASSPRPVALLERDLTLGDGELTPTLKVKRRIADERYRDLFEALYES